nr:putative UDP-glucose 4-epimerase [uncultured bacterium]
MKILVTGANGFVGRALCTEAVVRGMGVRGVTRVPGNVSAGMDNLVVGNIDGSTDWPHVVAGIECVVHLAARVHVMNDSSENPLAEFRRVNVQGTLNLARQAAAAGVRRFVFVSSVKVNGEATRLGRPFTADEAPAPMDAYGVSKMEAELGLSEIARQTGLEVVVIRPPLVYGPGVKANFATMMRWLKRGVPLPFGAIHNLRSLVSVDNLVDVLVTCIAHPAAADQTFLVSDGEDVSTTELLRRMGRAMGLPVRLVRVPAPVLELAAAMVGKRDLAQRLCGSLQVDIETTRRLLGWTPPLSLDDGLKRAAEAVCV